MTFTSDNAYLYITHVGGYQITGIDYRVLARDYW